jgi:hypothetical protein
LQAVPFFVQDAPDGGGSNVGQRFFAQRFFQPLERPGGRLIAQAVWLPLHLLQHTCAFLAAVGWLPTSSWRNGQYGKSSLIEALYQLGDSFTREISTPACLGQGLALYYCQQRLGSFDRIDPLAAGLATCCKWRTSASLNGQRGIFGRASIASFFLGSSLRADFS